MSGGDQLAPYPQLDVPDSRDARIHSLLQPGERDTKGWGNGHQR